MKVAMLTFYPRDLDVVPGGIRMVSLNLVRGLQRFQDLDLTVIHCHSDIADDAQVTQGRSHIRYLAMPRRRLVPNLITSVGRLVRAVRAVNPDLVHAHTAHFAYAGLKAGYPTILTIHGVLSEQRKVYNRTLYDRARYGMLAYYEAQVLDRVAQVTAISSYVEQSYAHRGSVGWVRINNPVPEEFFALQDRAEPGRILYAGSTDERKDLLTLLRAIEIVRAKMPDVCLCIAGHVTSRDYERRVHAYVKEHDLGANVRFLGLLDRQALLEQYARCSVVALASVEENSPMALIEGMAAGNPVVATRVGGVPDLVSEGETGLLAPARDPEALANCLLRLLLSPEERAEMGRRARAFVAAHFGLRKVSQAYYDLYGRAVARV